MTMIIPISSSLPRDFGHSEMSYSAAQKPMFYVNSRPPLVSTNVTLLRHVARRITRALSGVASRRHEPDAVIHPRASLAALSGLMRKSLAIAAFALAAIAAPAAAQSDASDALEAIDNPEMLESVAEGLEAATAALLAIPVGPLVDAMRRIDPDAAAEIGPGATLGDATGSDPQLAERLGDEARITGLVAGQTARDLAVALPMLQAMAGDLAAQWQQRIDDARRNQR